ncbi:MAG: hypothetical protein ACTSPQ_16085 [Candidatus Helarchaeota archaeon]
MIQSTYNISKTLLTPDILEVDAIKIGLLKEVKKLKNMLNDLKNQYEKLWLKCAKRNGLDRLLEKYKIMDFYYQKKIDEIEANINWEDPNHPAKWITYPKSKPFQAPRYYRKEFQIENVDEIDKCYIQGIANHFMKLYFNGEYLGYVISRNSLSFGMMDEQIKLFDISSKIRNGKNVIAIESYNFISNDEAINIYCEILSKNSEKSQKIISDTSWKCNLSINNDWTSIDYDDSNWLSAKIVGSSPKFNGRIIKPYLNKNIKSTNTYNFGLKLMLESFLPPILKPLIGIALSLMKLE